MKKVIIALILVVITVFLTACGNMSMGLGNYTFTHVHICDHSGHYSDASIEKWYENNNGIELLTKEYGSIFLSEGTYILFNDVCPLCGPSTDGK